MSNSIKAHRRREAFIQTAYSLLEKANTVRMFHGPIMITHWAVLGYHKSRSRMIPVDRKTDNFTALVEKHKTKQSQSHRDVEKVRLRYVSEAESDD